MWHYGGKSLHEQSYGESFMTLLLNRFQGNSLFILDEPEAALSPSRQFAMLARIHQLVQGNSTPNLDGIEEGYSVRDCETFFYLMINVSAENIDRVFRTLCSLVREPGFLLLEHGTTHNLKDELRTSDTDPFHKHVYCLDRLSAASFFQLVSPYMELLVNDGEIGFGFGSHQETDEVFVGLYKIFHIYTDEPQKYREELSGLGFQERNPNKTVWDNFTQKTPDGRMVVTRDCMDIYRMVELLQETGLYLAERRAEE